MSGLNDTPYTCILFVFISIPYENQHQTLNIGVKSSFESIQLRYCNLKRKYALQIICFLGIQIAEDFPNKMVYYRMHFYRHLSLQDSLKKFACSEILTLNGIFYKNYVMRKEKVCGTDNCFSFAYKLLKIFRIKQYMTEFTFIDICQDNFKKIACSEILTLNGIF